MKAEISDKKEIAEGILWVKFDLLGKKIDFKPGQFFYIDLINPPYKDIKGNHRHFTIVNSPIESGIIEMTTRIRESAFKKSLFELAIGSEVEIDGPDGNFVLPDDASIPLVFITGGIGITPFISMLRFIQGNNLVYKVSLLYSNRNKKSTAFLKELESITKINPKIKLALTTIIDLDFIKQYAPDWQKSVFMLSGPPVMVQAMRGELEKLGVDKRKIKFEEFVGY